jgi:hypothetical protein
MQRRRSGGHRGGDGTSDFFVLCGTGQRSHVRIAQRLAHGNLRDGLNVALGELLAHGHVDVHDLRRCADLSRVQVARQHDRRHGRLKVGVCQHDRRRLTAQLERDTRHVRRGVGEDLLAGARTAGHGD